jgi:hypothetical protein
LVRQNQLPPLLRYQPVLNQRQIEILITSVKLITHDRMTYMGQMNADLVFATGTRRDTEKRESALGIFFYFLFLGSV